MKANFSKFLILGILVCSTFYGVAQENKFLNRGYWKANPSIEQVEKDITAGNDVTELNKNFFDGVTYAILEKVDNTTIEHLIAKKGNEVNKLTHDGRTYIFWAAYRDNFELVQHLVANGAKANVIDSHGYSVLNFAANTGLTNLKVYDFLLANGADIKVTTHNGANALLLVSPFVKKFEVLDYFVSNGLPLNSVDETGNGLFQYAAKGGHTPLLKTLIAKEVDYKSINIKGENALFMSAQGTRGSQNGKPVFEYLEGLGLATDLINEDGKNLVHIISSRNENVELFQHLINQGLDVNLQDKQGSLPLVIASQSNSLEVIKLLVENTEDINLQNKKGHSALAMAVNRNSAEVVSFLLDKKASINTTDKKGNTLAFYLANNFDVKSPKIFEEKLQLLQDAGLDITKEQADGNTLLHLAGKDNNLSFLKRLEAFDMDVNQKNKEGNTPLHMAAMTSENDVILKYLIAQGADKSVKTDFDETVYDLAMENELLKAREVTLDFLK